jgi:hypothetical protein
MDHIMNRKYRRDNGVAFMKERNQTQNNIKLKKVFISSNTQMGASLPNISLFSHHNGRIMLDRHQFEREVALRERVESGKRNQTFLVSA